jgi:protein tyrosine/serine phosphatase
MRDPARQPVLVHCQYGVVRTGMMVAIYEVEVLGRDPEAAWADFELFGSELREPVSSRVADFVRTYEPLAQRAP